jgi:hypothetical protein
VLGRSNLFGKPMAQLLLAATATGVDLPFARADLFAVSMLDAARAAGERPGERAA